MNVGGGVESGSFGGAFGCNEQEHHSRPGSINQIDFVIFALHVVALGKGAAQTGERETLAQQK